MVLGIQPEHLRRLDAPSATSVPFTLELVEPVEPDTLLFVVNGDVSLVLRTVREEIDAKPGDVQHLAFPGESLNFFGARDGSRREPTA